MVIRITPAGGDAAAMLSAAIGQVRLARLDGTLHGPATIEFEAGTYPFAHGVTLTADDGGTASEPLVVRAVPGQVVRFSGGRSVRDFKPVTDAAILARMLPEARDVVLQADLRAQGISDFGVFCSRGFSRAIAPAMLEVFCQGKPMPLACWPRDGFATIKGFPVESKDEHGAGIGKLENGFLFDGDRPARWANIGDIMVHGYWAYDWANSYEKIASLDLQQRHIQLAMPGGLYGYRTGQRIQFLNILEELGAPGEWYLDRQSGILYFWPPVDMGDSDVTVSLLEEPFLTLDETAHVRVQGLTLEAGRGTGIRVNGGRDCRIEGCELRNLGNYGVIVEGGNGHMVRGCVLTGLGDGGIRMGGGDRRTLTPANHVVENNHIHHIARWSKCYVPAVLGVGVGIRIANNHIHDHPHCAILFSGNAFAIERNEIHHVCLETGDVGAIYTGRDYTFRDNLVRHNFIHHTGGVGMGSMGVYNDDCVSGTVIVGNVFWKVPRAVFLGGGRDFKVENNIFVDCTPAVALDGRGLSSVPVWHDMVYKTMREKLEAMNWRCPPYSEHYPELAALAPYFEQKDGVPPGNILVARNISVGGKWTEIGWGATPEMIHFDANLVDADPQFVDRENGNFELKATSPAFKLGFRRIPLEEIGLMPKRS